MDGLYGGRTFLLTAAAQRRGVARHCITIGIYLNATRRSWLVSMAERFLDGDGAEIVDMTTEERVRLRDAGTVEDAERLIHAFFRATQVAGRDEHVTSCVRAFAQLLRERGLDPVLPTHREG